MVGTGGLEPPTPCGRGACMNVCPVYRTVGGHSYGWTYPGPMGIVLTTLLTGMAKSHPLVDASTLCGACVEVCPVRIPLTDLFLKLRERRGRQGRRRTPSPPRESSVPPEGAMTSPDLVRRFLENAGNAAAGTHAVSDATDLRRVLSAIVPGTDPVFCPGLTDKEKAAAPSLPCRAADYAWATATVEEVYGAIAETGSLVWVSSGGRAVQAGLVPAPPVAIVSRERSFDTP